MGQIKVNLETKDFRGSYNRVQRIWWQLKSQHFWFGVSVVHLLANTVSLCLVNRCANTTSTCGPVAPVKQTTKSLH